MNVKKILAPAMTLALGATIASAATASAASNDVFTRPDVASVAQNETIFLNPLANDQGLYRFDSLRLVDVDGTEGFAKDSNPDYIFVIDYRGSEAGLVEFVPQTDFKGTATAEYTATAKNGVKVKGLITVNVGEGEKSMPTVPSTAKLPSQADYLQTVSPTNLNPVASSHSDHVSFSLENLDPESFVVVYKDHYGTEYREKGMDNGSYGFQVQEKENGSGSEVIFFANTDWFGDASVKWEAKTLEGKPVSGTLTVKNTQRDMSEYVGNEASTSEDSTVPTTGSQEELENTVSNAVKSLLRAE